MIFLAEGIWWLLWLSRQPFIYFEISAVACKHLYFFRYNMARC